MNAKLKKIFHNLPSVLAVFFGSAILIASLSFAWLVFVPFKVDVLQDWKLSIVNKKEYKAGDTITVSSKFKKVSDVSGSAQRFINCKTSSGSYTQYPLAQSRASSPMTNGEERNAEVVFRIPVDLTGLPSMCYVSIDIEYSINSFRRHQEHAQTEEFKVKPSPILPSKTNVNGKKVKIESI